MSAVSILVWVAYWLLIWSHRLSPPGSLILSDSFEYLYLSWDPAHTWSAEHANENRWPFCKRGSSLLLWFIIFNWYICFWMWAPKLQLTPCQCRFHLTLRGRAASKSVSDDPKNLSWRLFFPLQRPCVFDRIGFLLFSVFINITCCFFSVLIACESVFLFFSLQFG